MLCFGIGGAGDGLRLQRGPRSHRYPAIAHGDFGTRQSDGHVCDIARPRDAHGDRPRTDSHSRSTNANYRSLTEANSEATTENATD